MGGPGCWISHWFCFSHSFLFTWDFFSCITPGFSVVSIYITPALIFSHISHLSLKSFPFHLVLFTICLFHQRWKYPLIVSPRLFCILITLTFLCSPLLYHTYHFFHFNCLLTKSANFSFVWLFKYHTWKKPIHVSHLIFFFIQISH